MNKITIEEKYIEKIINIYLENIENYKFNNQKKDIVYFSIKGLEKFYFKNFEDLIIGLDKYDIFPLYKKEFIILLGKTSGSIKSINFLKEKITKFSELSKEIYWSIGMLASYKKYPVIKRNLLNDYLKRRLRVLKNKNSKNIDMFYFSLIEIFLLQNGINGKISNNLLEILHLNTEKNILKNILIKIINNYELSKEEKNIIIEIENIY